MEAQRDESSGPKSQGRVPTQQKQMNLLAMLPGPHVKTLLHVIWLFPTW